MHRKIIHSVTCFLHCEDQWLFVHRTKKGNSTDFGRLNGIGGKIELGESLLTAAIRETFEETGYQVSPKECQLKAKVSLRGGYADDWEMQFFRIEVPTVMIPRGSENDEGQLVWIPESHVLSTQLKLVDDINYCFDHIRGDDSRILQVKAVADEQEEIVSWHSSWQPH